MQINPFPGSDLWILFCWNSSLPAESLKTIKLFDAIFWGSTLCWLDYSDIRRCADGGERTRLTGVWNKV